MPSPLYGHNPLSSAEVERHLAEELGHEPTSPAPEHTANRSELRRILELRQIRELEEAR